MPQYTVYLFNIFFATFLTLHLTLTHYQFSNMSTITYFRRSQTFTREESGYYANFSRALSNQAKRFVTVYEQRKNQS